jgi:hypothetical protein
MNYSPLNYNLSTLISLTPLDVQIGSAINYNLFTLISLTPLEVQIGSAIFCSQIFSIYNQVLLPYKRRIKITILCKLLLSRVRMDLRSILTLLGSGHHKNLHETYHCRMYNTKLLMMSREDVRNM